MLSDDSDLETLICLDGYPGGSEFSMASFFRCPDGCTCLGFTVTCSEAVEEHVEEHLIVPDTTRMLDISGNVEAFHHVSFSEQYVQYIVSLNLSACAISTISTSTFKFLINLIILDLSRNYLEYLPSRLFASQTKLQILKIEDNLELLSIEEEAFIGLESVTYLPLYQLRIYSISKRAFASLNLDILDLSRTYIHQCEDNAFEALSVNNFFLNETDVVGFSSGLFEGLVNIEWLVTKAYKFCCVKPYFLHEDNCFPQRDEFSSCKDLMRNDILRPLLWIVGLLALLGNTLAFIYRLYDSKRMKIGYGIFVANLAISDFLMGLYLIIIASADMYYRGSYIFNDDYWRHGWLCQMAGVLATLSSEASVLFIGLITIDRFLVIKYPFGDYRMTQKPSWIFASATWFFALFVSIFPVVFPPFRGEFYSKSGVCLALPLTKDRPTGWLYSFLLFVAFNLFFVLLIAFGQWSIFSEVTSSSKKSLGKNRMNRKKELRVARNLLLVAFTDFICWFPIGMLGNAIVK